MRYNPEVVVCSTPKLLRDAAKACDKAKLKNIDICALVTDYCLDARFVNFKTNKYFVQNNDVKERLVSLGIEEEKIDVIGTPLSKRCCWRSYQNICNAIKFFKLINTFNQLNFILYLTVFGYQFAILNQAVVSTTKHNDIDVIFQFCKTCKHISHSRLTISSPHNDNVHFVIVNAKFLKHLPLVKSLFIEDKVKLIEGIDKFAKLYSVADILITSPTASITYEAMYHNKNLILCNGGDALENRNSHYLATNQLALLGRNNDELIASISKIMSDVEFANDMMYAQNEFVIPDCDKVMGDIILKLAEKNRNDKLEEKQQVKNAGLKELENLEADEVDTKIVEEDKND